jgi:hypothetical protein
MKWGVIFLAMFSLAHAGEYDLPKGFLSEVTLAEQFRLSIQNKLTQMRQNFVERSFSNGTRFYATNDITCPQGTKVQSRNDLLRMRVTQDVDEQLTENIFYYGCRGSLTMREQVVTSGKKLTPASVPQLLMGQLNTSLTADETSKDYRLLDGQGDQVFRILTRLVQGRLINHFYLNDQQYLRITRFKRSQYLEVRYEFFPIHFSMNRNGFEFSMSLPARFEGYYSARIYNNGVVHYYNEKRDPVSLATFQNSFKLEGFSFILDSMLIELPQTKFVTSGLRSGRMLEELRNAQTWLINGIQLNLVRNMVEEYIKAVQQGLIIDNRPAKQQ